MIPNKEAIMKINMRWVARITVVLLTITVLFGCMPPGSINAPAQGTPPAGLAQAYNDAEWEILSNEEGTLAYQIPAGDVPDVEVGDQIVHGNELLEVAAVVAKTNDALVVHTIQGNMAKLFPPNSTLTMDTETMTATVEYVPEGRAIASSYTLPVVLKQVREINPDGTETILYDDNPARSITLINVNDSTSIVNIDKTLTQDIFNVSGSGTQSAGNVSVTYEGDAKLTLQERLKLKANFNLRLYLDLDAGIRLEKRTKTIRYWLITWHTATITYYVPVAWATLNKDLKASISGEALFSANADLSCNGSVTGSYSLPLPLSLQYNFVIGPVPVEIGYTPYLAVDAVAAGTVNATTGASFSCSGEWGAQCTNSGWSKINTFSTATDYIKPELTAAATLSIIPQIKNEIRAGIGFSNTGVFGTITLSPYLKMTAAAGLESQQRTWDISCGITGDVGVKASVVGYDLGSYNARIFDFNKVISSGTY
jgi:hypothetical protein